MTLGYTGALLKEMEEKQDDNNRLRVSLAKILWEFAPLSPCGCNQDTGDCAWHQALDLVKDEYYSMFD